MTDFGVKASHLRIRQLHMNCLVPSDHPSPEKVSRHLTDVAERSLPASLASILQTALPERDQSLWFIKRLDFLVDANAACNPDQLARCFAVRTAQSLFVELGSVGDGANVIRFNGPAEYLATFLTDLAQGRAWGNWYYERLDGLRMLPLSAALRTAICDDVMTGLTAMHQMTLPALREIVLQMTDPDAERVLQTLADGATADSEKDCYQIVMLSVKRLTAALLGHLSKAKAALLLYLDATQAAVNQIDYQAAEAAQTIVGLIRCLEESSLAQRRRLLLALKNRDTALLYQSVVPAQAEQLAPLLHLSDTALNSVLGVVVRREGVQAENNSASPELRTTAFGGAFFLLPLIDELPIAKAVRSLPDADGINPEAIIRWVLLVKCFGQTISKSLARDPVIQELAGLAPAFLSREPLVGWQRKITLKQIDELLAEITCWRWNNRIVGARVCVLTQVEINRQKLSVMLDGSKGCWLFLLRLSGRDDKILIRALQQLSFSPEAILCDRIYQPVVRELFSKTNVIDLNDLPAVERSEYGGDARSVLTVLPEVYAQASYLSLPTEFGIASRLDRALSVVAQGLLRDFAWRLPGFAWSQPAYLAENFLGCQATVEDEVDRCVVRLGRPPLDLLLNMTGLNRLQYKVSWLKGRRFELYPDPV